MTDSLSVSVVLPVYNAGRYLAAAIESVLSQTFAAFEMIAVDDGSTDESAAILARFARQDARVRVISIERGGLARALNVGIEAAKGDLIARMDADDICLPLRFERQVAFLAAHPEIVAVGTSYRFIDEDGADLCPRSAVFQTHEQIEAAHFSGKGGAIGHPTVMMRREALARVGGYRELEHCEDLDLWFRLGEIGRLANLPEALLKYRLRVSSVSATMRDRRSELMTSVIEAANERRGTTFRHAVIEPMLPVSRLEYAHQCAWLAIGAGNIATAQKHARKAVALSPLSVRSWRLAVGLHLPVGVKRLARAFVRNDVVSGVRHA